MSTTARSSRSIAERNRGRCGQTVVEFALAFLLFLGGRDTVLAQRRVNRVAIICPSFVADCL